MAISDVITTEGWEFGQVPMSGLTQLAGSNGSWDSTITHNGSAFSGRLNLTSQNTFFAIVPGQDEDPVTTWDTTSVRFYMYIATLPSVTSTFYVNIDSVDGAEQVGALRIRSDGKIDVWDTDDTVVGTSTTALVTGRWYQIGFRATTSTDTLILEIDGREEVNDATGTLTNESKGPAFGPDDGENVTYDIYFDDFIMSSGTTIPHGGQSRILKVIADGGKVEFDTPTGSATHWENVDDLTGLNEHEASGAATDLYETESISGWGAISTISAVMGIYRMARGTGGGSTHQVSIVENSTETHTTIGNLDGSFRNRYVIYNTPPTSGGVWEEGKINGLEIGAKHASGNQDTGIQGAIFNVDYTPFNQQSIII